MEVLSNQCSTTIQSQVGDSFKTNIPMEKNIEFCYRFIADRMNNNKSWKMLLVQQSIEKYTKEIQEYCDKFCAIGIKDAKKAKRKNLSLIYRINLSKNWRGEFILYDNKRIYKEKIVNGPPLIATIQSHCENEDTTLEKEYILMRLLIDFNSYYHEKGRIFPASIEVVDNKQSC